MTPYSLVHMYEDHGGMFPRAVSLLPLTCHRHIQNAYCVVITDGKAALSEPIVFLSSSCYFGFHFVRFLSLQFSSRPLFR
jgi:hypothetical protein